MRHSRRGSKKEENKEAKEWERGEKKNERGKKYGTWNISKRKQNVEEEKKKIYI